MGATKSTRLESAKRWASIPCACERPLRNGGPESPLFEEQREVCHNDGQEKFAQGCHPGVVDAEVFTQESHIANRTARTHHFGSTMPFNKRRPGND